MRSCPLFESFVSNYTHDLSCRSSYTQNYIENKSHTQDSEYDWNQGPTCEKSLMDKHAHNKKCKKHQRFFIH